MTINRRTWLAGSLGGFFAFSMRNQCDHLFAAKDSSKAPAKRCVVLWMEGGPSQFETFDPKPGASTGGEFKAIKTRAPGIEICETLPKIAQKMQSLSLIRNLTSTEGEHVRASYYMHTGYPFVPTFPRPPVGSLISRETADSAVPKYVSIGSHGYGPAYAGPEHAPFSIENPDHASELLRRIRRHKSELDLIEQLGSEFDKRFANRDLKRRQSQIRKIRDLVETRFVDALNLQKEKPETVARYGDSDFGRGCLLTRRLLESGVRFVEVQQGGWDTHSNNFPEVKRLCQKIDQPVAALLDDLEKSGMLSETIVLWMGEFGRTPRINAQRGRDHFPKVCPVMIGGGGLAGGKVVGKTNRQGTEIIGSSHRISDLMATILKQMGVDSSKEYMTDFGSPTHATDKGKVIEGIIS